MDASKKIRVLGEGLKGRLDPSLVDFSLDYINFSESLLAFETLCDYIGDYDIIISKDEYLQVIDIVRSFGLVVENRYKYIDPERIRTN